MTRHSYSKIEKLANITGYRVIKHSDAIGYYYTLKNGDEYILHDQRNFKKIHDILIKALDEQMRNGTF